MRYHCKWRRQWIDCRRCTSNSRRRHGIDLCQQCSDETQIAMQVTIALYERFINPIEQLKQND